MIAKMAARHTREIFRTASDCSASWQGVCEALQRQRTEGGPREIHRGYEPFTRATTLVSKDIEPMWEDCTKRLGET